MNVLALAAVLAMQGGVAAQPDTTVGYVELATGDADAALVAIAQSDVDERDPAILINEGVALARLGEYEAARARFEMALTDAERMRLETASGDWVDSHRLAKQGIALLENGDFQRYVAINAR